MYNMYLNNSNKVIDWIYTHGKFDYVPGSAHHTDAVKYHSLSILVY